MGGILLMALSLAAAFGFSRGPVLAVVMVSTVLASPLLSVGAYIWGGTLQRLYARLTGTFLRVAACRVFVLHVMGAAFAGFIVWENPFESIIRDASGCYESATDSSEILVQALIPWIFARFILWQLENYQPNVVCPTEMQTGPDLPLAEAGENHLDGEDWTAN